MKHDLLTEDILTWRGRDRVAHDSTLPGVIAALSRGEVMDFPRARAHQQHPWSMFLTQLAAIAMNRSGVEEPPQDDHHWSEMLLALTENQYEPWCLVVDDLSKAAFFQPPVPEGELRKPPKKSRKAKKEKQGDEWRRCEAPDDLDILVTSKRHDVKSSLIAADDLEAWAYALCTLQTMQGYPGRGYTQVARMNGGYGNRPRVGFSSGPDFGGRFRRDLRVLLAGWQALVERGFNDDGVALVWLEPWDGATALSVMDLAPHFIEVCWRIRAVSQGGRVLVRYTTSTSRRCAPEISGGDVGDPWAPVSRKDDSVLTVGSGGYHYKLLVELLFGADYVRAPAQELFEDDQDPVLLWVFALARGQGKTEGIHERVIPLSAKSRRMFLAPDTRDVLGRRAEQRVKRAADMRSRVLFPALKAISLGSSPPRDDLDDRIDERFFVSLFSSVEDDEESAKAQWDDELTRLAQDELETAIQIAPLSDARYWRATTEARGVFYGCLRKRFPDAFARLRKDAGDEATVTEVS